MVLLDSGFHPESSPILREKLKNMVVKKIENRTDKRRTKLCRVRCARYSFVFSIIFLFLELTKRLWF